MKEIREKDFLDFVGLQESQYLEPASTWLDELLDYETQKAEGDLLPWSKTHDLIQFRRGEVTIWGGYNGHGKSLVLNQAILYWMQESKAVIASLEMKPAATLYRMLLQTGSAAQPSQDYKRSFSNWTDNKLWIYDQLDQVPFERIVGMVHYSAQELGCKHIVIDSLMKCGINDDDYNGQKNFVDHLCWAAKNENVHIHLVAHMKKRGSESEEPGKFDIFGSSAITNLVDQLIIIHRNKDKEELIQKGETVEDHIPDAKLLVRKNRHGGTEGAIGLYYAPQYQQFNQKPKWQDMRINIPMISFAGSKKIN